MPRKKTRGKKFTRDFVAKGVPPAKKGGPTEEFGITIGRIGTRKARRK